MTPPGLSGSRIAIIGNSGAGKSNLARALSARLKIPHIELDALNWQPGWKALSLEDPDEWVRVVAEAIGGDAWITDGNYSKGALPQILHRATDVIWLDYGRWLIIGRVIRRSFWRALRREELWAGTGNRETFQRWLQRDHPIRWTWDTYRDANARRESHFSDPRLTHVRKHRLSSPRDTRLWCAQIASRLIRASPLATR